MKKTLFGVILATFLMMSVSWIAPVNVQAAEINKKEILENTNGLINALIEEQDSLLTIIEDSETTEIVIQLMDAETNTDKENLIIEYCNLLESKYNEELAALESSSSVYIDNLQDLLSDITINPDNSKDQPTYYKITKTPSSVKVTKTESEEIDDNEILFRVSDGSVKTNDMGWLEGLLRDLSEAFLNLFIDLLPILTGVALICLVVEFFALILLLLGFAEISDIIMAILVPVVFVLDFMIIGLMALPVFFGFLANLVALSKERTSETRLSVFKNKLYQLLEKVFLFFENIKAQGTF